MEQHYPRLCYARDWEVILVGDVILPPPHPPDVH